MFPVAERTRPLDYSSGAVEDRDRGLLVLVLVLILVSWQCGVGSNLAKADQIQAAAHTEACMLATKVFISPLQ